MESEIVAIGHHDGLGVPIEAGRIHVYTFEGDIALHGGSDDGRLQVERVP